MPESTLENVAGGRPLGQPRKRKKTKLIIGEAAKHPVTQIGPKEQTFFLKNIGKRGGDPTTTSITIGPAVKPNNSPSGSIGRVDARSRRK
jgi:hypothetical protein